MAIGPVGTMVQLYLVQINGVSLGTVYAGLAVGIYSAVTIPASIFWGIATDRFHSRKGLIVLSYAATSISFFLFVLAPGTAGSILAFAILSFVITASATPLNLLIMESEPKNTWASSFAKLSLMGTVGNTLGLVVSSLWVEAFPLLLMAIPLGALCLASVILAVRLIVEPSYVFEREVIIRNRPSFLTRLLSVPSQFVTIPRPVDFKRIFVGLRSELTSYLPLLYLSITCFYVGGGLFNASIVPAMSEYLGSGSEVFLVNLIATIVSIVGFLYADRYIKKTSLIGSMTSSTVLRASCYALLGVSALVVPNALYLVPSLTIYPIGVGLAFAIYYTSSNTLVFDSVQNRSHGSAMGVYNAVVGMAGTAGSLVSGFVSFYLGFATTFIAGGLFVGVAAILSFRLTRVRGGGGA
jgi:MFS family permease